MPPLPTYKGIVYPWHCDHMGHMNVMWYVGKFDEATWGFFGGLGINSSLLKEQNRGMAALDQHVVYKREVFAGNSLEIYTKPIEVRNKTIRFMHTMINCESGEISATCELVGAYTDAIARKAIPFSDDIRQKAQSMIDDD